VVMYICVRGIDFPPVSTICLLDFEAVLTVLCLLVFFPLIKTSLAMTITVVFLT
jgi:hypothetical protein